MKLKIILDEPNLLRESISIIRQFIQETVILIKKEELVLIDIDESQVAYVILKMSKKCFKEFIVEDEMRIAVNLEKLYRILSKTKDTDTLILESDGNILKINIMNLLEKKFILPLIDTQYKELKRPILKTEFFLNTNVSLFLDAMNSIIDICEKIGFEGDKDKLKIFFKEQQEEAEVSLVEDDKNVFIDYEKDDNITSYYSTSYLKNMLSASRITNNVVLTFGNQYPMQLEFDLIKNNERTLSLIFILSPRIEKEVPI